MHFCCLILVLTMCNDDRVQVISNVLTWQGIAPWATKLIILLYLVNFNTTESPSSFYLQPRLHTSLTMMSRREIPLYSSTLLFWPLVWYGSLVNPLVWFRLTVCGRLIKCNFLQSVFRHNILFIINPLTNRRLVLYVISWVVNIN